ncbi:MAG: hypothetical protein LBT99_00905, partial [Bifidobacteriaceae bacterium]|nr:hypothetical protein [Bifidobacteriaceae bacterium]
RTNLNAQETLVSGTNIKSIFGQSLLGSGNLNPITINKTSDLVIGETALLRAGFGSTVTFYGVTCVFDTGVCSWALKPYGDAYFVYDTGDGVVKSYTKASAASTTDISLKLLSIKSGQSWAKGFILMTTGHYEYEFYKGVGNGAFYFIRRTS